MSGGPMYDLTLRVQVAANLAVLAENDRIKAALVSHGFLYRPGLVRDDETWEVYSLDNLWCWVDGDEWGLLDFSRSALADEVAASWMGLDAGHLRMILDYLVGGRNA